MLRLGLKALRMGAGSRLGCLVVIAITATIVAGAGQIMATALGAPGAGRFAAADLVARADPTVRLGSGNEAETLAVRRAALLPPTALARAAAVPGVARAVGDVSFPVSVIGRGGVPLPTEGESPAHAHGWPSAALTPYRLAVGHAPEGAGQLVLDAGLARAGGLHVGDRVRVVTPTGTKELGLVGIVDSDGAQAERQSSVFLAEDAAQRFSGLGPGFDAIAIDADHGADLGRLREALGTAIGGEPQVLAHDHAAEADAGDPRAFERVELVAVIAAGGGMTVAVSIFVLAGTIGFAISRRRRRVALLRVVGATRSQVRKLLALELAFLGLLGGLAGCLAAAALSSTFTGALISVGLAPDGFAVAPSWIPYAIAVAGGVVVALLAGLVSVHRYVNTPPSAAMLDSALERRRLNPIRALLGTIALAGGVALIIILADEALNFATLSALLFAIAVALLGPVLLGRPVALVGRLLAGGSGSRFLAGSALGGGRFRVGAVGAAIALVVALAGTQVVGLATARRTTQQTTARRVLAQHVLVDRDGAGLPPSVARAAAKLPGARVAAVAPTEVYLPEGDLSNQGDGWEAAGIGPLPPRGALDLGVSAGSLAAVRGDGIAVSQTLAGEGATLGRVVRARLADNTPVRLRVVAIYRNANGLGDIVLPHSLALAHAEAAVDGEVFVAGHGPALERGLARLARKVPTTTVLTRGAYLDQVKAEGQEDARAQWVIVALMILVAAMAAFNAGAMAAADRRGELRLARLNGATGGQVAGALGIESALITLAGLGAGIAIVIASLAGAGSDPDGGALVVPLGQAGLVLALGAGLGLLGTLVPAALLGRGRGAEARV